jgi:hypothetical protein
MGMSELLFAPPETVDRNRVEQEYLRIKRTPEYRRILRRKQSSRREVGA